MEIILDVAERLAGDRRIRFLMVGDGAVKGRLVADTRRRGLDNIEFVSSQQPDELVGTIRGADVCLATTMPGEFSAGTVPVKVFDYMACARPVVAAVLGDARAVVEDSGGGLVVEPGDGDALAAAVLRLVDDPEMCERLGRNGREFVARHYSRTRLAERMEEVLSDVVARDRAVGGSRLGFRHYLAAKYALDAVAAVVVLVVGAPVLLVLSLLVRLDSPGRAIFTQRRVGVHSYEFDIAKFRTMERHAPDLATDVMMGEPRDYTTRVGRFLRRTSLDELPNFWSILKGDMSVVGPRPALYNQCELVEMRRQLGVDIVRPGITGWAQINGRDSITVEEKVRLDEFYVRRCSLLLDLRILLRTFAAMRDDTVGPPDRPGPEAERRPPTGRAGGRNAEGGRP
jgi:O-antigen biosynthesis protein WbqP